MIGALAYSVKRFKKSSGGDAIHATVPVYTCLPTMSNFLIFGAKVQEIKVYSNRFGISYWILSRNHRRIELSSRHGGIELVSIMSQRVVGNRFSSKARAGGQEFAPVVLSMLEA